MSKKPIAKIVSKEVAFWTNLVEGVSKQIEYLKKELKAHEVILNAYKNKLRLAK